MHLLDKFFYHTIFIYFLISGVPLGEACSIVLRGATEQIIGEAERSLHDALCVLTSTVKETKTTFGGGMFEYIHHEIPYHQSISFTAYESLKEYNNIPLVAKSWFLFESTSRPRAGDFIILSCTVQSAISIVE